MADSKKRKDGPGGDRNGKAPKRSKGGSGGKWQTPHQQAKLAASRGSGRIEFGDIGIFATCARDKEGRATEELKEMFTECAERFYGIVSGPDESDNDDIESSIKKEIASMGNTQTAPKLFSPVRIDLPCVLFFKTRPPIDPVDFVQRICEEIVKKPGMRRMRYVNRLTPVTLVGKANEKGLEELGKAVLSHDFQLSGQDDVNPLVAGNADADAAGKASPYSYAIRPTIRNHNTLKRDTIIKQIASSISDVHKVNLTTPDKVIIVEVYQTICGMSVVGSDWETLKRFNLAELYQPPSKMWAPSEAEAKPEPVTTDEAAAIAVITDDAVGLKSYP